MGRSRAVLFWGFWFSLMPTTGACTPEPAREEPFDVIREFVDTLQKAHGNPSVSAHAYSLLWERARSNLDERARRASALSGRSIQPGEMIAPSWFTLRTPLNAPAETRVEGDWAEVLLQDAEPARIRLVREASHWRLALELPEPPPIRQRPNPDAPER